MRMTLKDRFESHFVYLLPSTCIVTDYKKEQRGGHTEVKVKGKQVRAHRLSWELYKGEIPENRQVNHTCHNPKCVNPDHLYIGTQKDNVRDMIVRGTFIVNGLYLRRYDKKANNIFTLSLEEKRIRHREACKKWRAKQRNKLLLKIVNRKNNVVR